MTENPTTGLGWLWEQSGTHSLLGSLAEGSDSISLWLIWLSYSHLLSPCLPEVVSGRDERVQLLCQRTSRLTSLPLDHALGKSQQEMRALLEMPKSSNMHYIPLVKHPCTIKFTQWLPRAFLIAKKQLVQLLTRPSCFLFIFWNSFITQVKLPAWIKYSVSIQTAQDENRAFTQWPMR